MNASPKAPAIENLLTALSGADRRAVIKSSKCMPAPIGCGQEVCLMNFDNELSIKEYGISGLCQNCQDEFFGAA